MLSVLPTISPLARMFDRMLEKQGLNQNDIDLIVELATAFIIDFAEPKLRTCPRRQYYIPGVKELLTRGQDSKAMIIRQKLESS